ncbi:hypothetical protein GQ55_4G134000 [Panicum hallii var. hallii]|uniref:Uncharacterized protein n=1 Tax=Panicum hallii var. hallii TaxID=1504633 RepID=A0A2T7DY61_9POAL|nr:hypothetical protein GQ55_4G134000 [Panicum hallii var. hallii]
MGYGPDSPFRHVDHEALHLHQIASSPPSSPLDSPPPLSPLVSVLHLRLLAPLAFHSVLEKLSPPSATAAAAASAPPPRARPVVAPRSVSPSRARPDSTRGCFVCPFPWLLAAPAGTLPCRDSLAPCGPCGVLT